MFMEQAYAETYKKIQSLIEEKTGIELSFFGFPFFEKSIQERLTTLSIPVEEYYPFLSNNPTEFQELIELFVNSETWFFRERKGIDYVVDLAKKKCEEGNSPILILSAAASSGEEPYSIAMALFDKQLLPSDFRIDAVDISNRSLVKALQGRYKNNSFRGQDLFFQQRYFQLKDNLYHLDDQVKAQVHFMHDNLVNSDLFLKKRLYDVIFCRNLLIYLNPKAQENVIFLMDHLLKENGVLIVAPAETELLRTHGFLPEADPGVCAFRKKSTQKIEAKIAKKTPSFPSKNSFKFREGLATMVQNNGHVEKDLLKQAFQHADKGELDEAMQTCQLFVQTHGANADAYYLLGVLHQAIGHNDEAEAFYRKSIYLNPNHYQALTYLALLLEIKGEKDDAFLLYQRAEKIEKKLKEKNG
ncbi:methylase of chemotaxis methyl-accepting proteins CheR [Parachlamydia acanthamoebae UV-7]|uniref:protein-glutamate O-methyltransferase n=3 Tax=Parachlamydia acanthamoebae TaxID=83552 RepID=F8KZ41_PARAV|nr:methylase of chemotaxis methyl-accepting proteins CheR [Parachlamydia acanthamoebae UV-7]